MSRILLADDYRDGADATSKLLELRGHSVTICNSGTQAIESCRVALESGNCFDLLILDLAMPDKSGFETLEEIRGLGCQTKVVFFTANGDSIAKGRAVMMKAKLWEKNVFGIEFCEKVEELIGQR